MKRGVVGIFLFMFLISFAAADFEVGNLSHQLTKTAYGPEETIQGWINISLDDESTNSVFEDSEENSISLISLLGLNTDLEKGTDYTCSIIGCESDYDASDSGQSTKLIILNQESSILGIKFSGEITSITSVNFSINSAAGESCENQLKIDFLNDDNIDLKNENSGTNYCSDSKDYGCYDDAKTNKKYNLGTTYYCQGIELGEYPGFKIGAWVKEESSGNAELTMSLYTSYGEEKESCELVKSPGEGEISCEINYSTMGSEDYYICIKSDGGSGNYKIRGNSNPTTGCGFYGHPVPSNTPGAYQIFAEGKQFGSVVDLYVPHSITANIQNYILEKYGSLDCSDDCYVPIKIISGVSQTITLQNLELVYRESSGEITESNANFYELDETASLVSSDFIQIFLDKGNFTLPDEYGETDYRLDLDETKIFSEEIDIEKIPLIERLIPMTTASAFPTEFEVKIDSSANITKYEWDFGDNKTSTTTKNKAVHTYESTGTYELEITVTDTNNKKATKSFSIEVSTPENEINESLEKKLNNLKNLDSQIDKFELFTQESLKSVLNLTYLETALTDLQKDFLQASSEEEYNSIITNLVKLDVPESVRISEIVAPLPFFPKISNIDLEALIEITGEEYDSDQEYGYTEAVLGWEQQYLDAKIRSKKISGKYDGEEESILRIFEIKITEKETLSTNPYFVVEKLENLKFKENYGEQEVLGYKYIELEGSKTILFSTTEDINFVDLPAFIAPEIKELTTIAEGIEEKPKTSKWVIFTLVLGLLVIGGIVTYVILQEWYKKKYEEHLFKNRNNLFNLINYIEGVKRKGLTNKEITSKLKKAGWNSEQISYALKKHAGKRTGMAELPFKFWKKKNQFPRNMTHPRRGDLQRKFSKKRF